MPYDPLSEEQIEEPKELPAPRELIQKTSPVMREGIPERKIEKNERSKCTIN